MKISVVGLGKIGLPLAAQYASKHKQVYGLDIDGDTVAKINRAEIPFPGEVGLSEKLREVIELGYLKATTDYEFSIKNSDVIVVIVPLFVNKDNLPEFSNYDLVVDTIGKLVKPGTLICFETTLPVGTTRNRFAPILERNSGLKIGRDLYVVFSPERVSSGNIFRDLRKYPKIVGGITQKCAEIAKNFYSQVLDFDVREDLETENGVWIVNSSEEAEMTKLAETTYRDVNIALANQFFLYCEKNEIDFYQVAKSANSQSYSNIHTPGISVGGHCIPVYPYFYLQNDSQASIVQAARQQNEAMPRISIKMIEKFSGSVKGRSILIEGISYRSGVKEVYGSGVWHLIAELEAKGAQIFVNDEKYSKDELEKLKLGRYIFNGESIDCIILHTYEPSTPGFIKKISNSGTKVFDGRNYLENSENVGALSVFGFSNRKDT